MRQGDRRGVDVNFADFTYDGDNIDGQLSGGLGQLTDTEEGLANFRSHQPAVNSGTIRRRGYEWIAWRFDEPPRGSSSSEPVADGGSQNVEIRFTFDQVRLITGLRLHCNNAISRDVAVFRAAEMRFQLDDDDDVINVDRSPRDAIVARMSPVYYEHQRDMTSELPRYVTVPIPRGGRIGRHVRLILEFDLRWIMISEIRFDTRQSSSNFSLQQIGQMTRLT